MLTGFIIPIFIIKPFQIIFSSHASLKTWENVWFSDVFRGYGKGTVDWNVENNLCSLWNKAFGSIYLANSKKINVVNTCVSSHLQQRKIWTWVRVIKTKQNLERVSIKFLNNHVLNTIFIQRVKFTTTSNVFGRDSYSIKLWL